MQTRYKVTQEVFNTDWAGEGLTGPVGVPLRLSPQLWRHVPGVVAMLVDPPVLQVKKETRTKMETASTHGKHTTQRCKRLKKKKNTTQHLGEVPKMNPRSRDGKNPAITSTSNEKQENKKDHTHKKKQRKPACFGLGNGKPESHFHTAGPRQPRRILNQNQEEPKVKANMEKEETHQHDESHTKNNTRGFSATCSHTKVERSPLGFKQKSKRAAPRNKAPADRRRKAHRK